MKENLQGLAIGNRVKKMKLKLKAINERYTYSKHFKEEIDSLIDRHAFTCVVYGGKLFDHEQYTHFQNEEFQSLDNKKGLDFDNDFIVVQQLVELLTFNKEKVVFSALGFADDDLITNRHRELSSLIGIPDDVPALSFIVGETLDIDALYTKMISQPFVAIVSTRSEDPVQSSLLCAVIEISDGEAFLVIS